MTPPRIALDLGGLDGLWPGAGLYRYAVDLVHSLSELCPPARFVVLGATPQPVADLSEVFHNGSKWEYLHFARTGGLGTAYLDHLRLAVTLKRLRADLCHCLHSFAPVVSSCPVVGTVQDMMFELFPEYATAVRSRPYRMYRWAARRRLRRIICPSQTTADDLHRLWGVPLARIDVVPHGLRVFGSETVVNSPDNPKLRQLPTDPLLTSPLNLEPRKNLHTLLAAFTQVRRHFPLTSLVLYGRGGWNDERERNYRRQLEELGLCEAVIETGVLSDSDLWHLYRRTAVFVFPTLYEGFGYPVVEAMTAGACPVVRGLSAMAESVGPAGVQVEPFTPEALAGAVCQLLTDTPRRLTLAAAARERSRLFSSRRMAEGTFHTYSRVLPQLEPRS